MKNPLVPSLLSNSFERWQNIVARYQSPETGRSLWQIANSLLPYLFLWYLMYRSLEISYLLTLLLAIPAAGFLVRLFIIFHDCGHGSFFKSRRANRLVGWITGVLVMTPFEHWTHDHAIHHATAANLDKRGVGDVTILTVSEYMALPWPKKLGYRIMRHPLILFTIGSFLVFTVFHRFWRPGTGPRERRSVLGTDLILLLLLGGLSLWIGWQAVLMIQAPIMFVAASVGVWLFYVQHNFPDVYLARQEQWDFLKAGLQGSSYYQLPAILRWFTGNIGYHHIHHLSPRIPNYKLPRCHAENPLFHVKPLTLWSSFRSLGIRLYDEQERVMVSFRALKKY